MFYLYDIAKNGGYKDVVLGNLFIGGCSLRTHINNARTGRENYIYFKNNAGEWVPHKNKPLLYGIQDEDWDIITLQQYSGHSGVVDTYNQDLDDLIAYVNKNKTNPQARLAWHMTWAYETTSDHPDFAIYNRNQKNMYNCIVNAVKSRIADNQAFSFIIPAGTAIQTLRASFIGENLTRDGYHLNNLGRYAAALCWYSVLLDKNIDKISFVPEGISLKQLEIVKRAVEMAVNYPLP
ncbi:MAG TPA: DUF4886 domain-containing protein [Clostridiales bacterium]|nr:DUF4886 domain-containing protein [Clostridiales bacterium]